MEREDFRTITESARFEIRKRAIKLLKSGKKQCDVAEIIGTKKGTICQWNKLYKSKGFLGLKAHKNGGFFGI